MEFLGKDETKKCYVMKTSKNYLIILKNKFVEKFKKQTF